MDICFYRVALLLKTDIWYIAKKMDRREGFTNRLCLLEDLMYNYYLNQWYEQNRSIWTMLLFQGYKAEWTDISERRP